MKSNRVNSYMIAALLAFSLPVGAYAGAGCCSGHGGFSTATGTCGDATGANKKSCGSQLKSFKEQQKLNKKVKPAKQTKQPKQTMQQNQNVPQSTTTTTTKQQPQKKGIMQKLFGGSDTNNNATTTTTTNTKAKTMKGAHGKSLRGCCSDHGGVKGFNKQNRAVCNDETVSPTCGR